MKAIKILTILAILLGIAILPVQAQTPARIPARETPARTMAGAQSTAPFHRVNEYTLSDGLLLGSVALLDGSNAVISLERGESAWYLAVTLVGDGMQVDRVTLPYGKPGDISITAAGSNLHVTIGWPGLAKIASYHWTFSSPFSREYSLFIPAVNGQ
jgi:hypothetical protein